MARVHLGESRLKARRSRRRLLFVGVCALATLLLLGALVAISWAPFMRVGQVSVLGVRALDAKELEEVVWQELAGGWGYMFARSNIFLYPQKEITRELTRRFPTIKTVTVQAEDFKSVAVTIAERQPAALWCGESQASSTACHFLDEDGLVYAPAAMYSDGVYQTYYGPLQNAEAGQGQFLTAAQFHALPPLLESLQKSADTGSLQFIAVNHEGDVRAVFAGGFAVLFGVADSGSAVLERFLLALAAEPFVDRALSDFEYLDVRFGDKVYYKLKGQ